VAEILLTLSQPNPNIPEFSIHGREGSEAAIEGHVLKICGLAFTNENVSARVNAFGPLAFCKFPSTTLIRSNIDINKVANT
jgi:hypothetical protein